MWLPKMGIEDQRTDVVLRLRASRASTPCTARRCVKRVVALTQRSLRGVDFSRRAASR